MPFKLNCYLNKGDANPAHIIFKAPFIPQIGVTIAFGDNKFVITEIIEYRFKKSDWNNFNATELIAVDVLIKEV